MAHNLNFNEQLGRYAFVSRKEVPWHGLGKVVEEAMTSHEAIELAGLDYEVGLAKLHFNIDRKIEFNGTVVQDRITTPNHFATYRKDTFDYFGVVGNRYEVVQNREAFSFFDNIVGKKEAIFETAGALGKGETIFVSAKLPGYIKVGTDDIIDKYLLFTSSHDGTGSIKAMFTPVRVVCNNTLNQALRNGTNKLTLKHTANVHARLNEGIKLMGLSNIYYEDFQQCLNYLASVQLSTEQVSKTVYSTYLNTNEIILLEKANNRIELVDEISTNKKNTIDKVFTSILNGVGQDKFRGSAYWLYNGFTNYYSNLKEYKTNEDKFTTIIDGSVANIQQKVFNYIINEVN